MRILLLCVLCLSGCATAQHRSLEAEIAVKTLKEGPPEATAKAVFKVDF